MERQIINLKNIYIPLIKSTIETKYDKYGNKVSIFETVKEVYEETVTKDNNIFFTRDPTASLP